MSSKKGNLTPYPEYKNSIAFFKTQKNKREGSKMIAEKEILKKISHENMDKRLGYRREVANAEISGEDVSGMVFFFSTPIGMMICAEINCGKKHEGNIFKLAFTYKEKEINKSMINKNFPLMYVKNGKAWLRYITAKLNYHDIIDEEIMVYTIDSDMEIESAQDTAHGKITLPQINKSAINNLNHA